MSRVSKLLKQLSQCTLEDIGKAKILDNCEEKSASLQGLSNIGTELKEALSSNAKAICAATIANDFEQIGALVLEEKSLQENILKNKLKYEKMLIMEQKKVAWNNYFHKEASFLNLCCLLQIYLHSMPIFGVLFKMHASYFHVAILTWLLFFGEYYHTVQRCFLLAELFCILAGVKSEFVQIPLLCGVFTNICCFYFKAFQSEVPIFFAVSCMSFALFVIEVFVAIKKR